MKSRLGPTFFFRAVGVSVLLLEASLWPNIHGQVIIAALGFIGSAEFFEKGKK
jgi:hypothetical protein